MSGGMILERKTDLVMRAGCGTLSHCQRLTAKPQRSQRDAEQDRIFLNHPFPFAPLCGRCASAVNLLMLVGWMMALAFSTLLGFSTLAPAAPAAALERAIGIEGDVAVALPRGDYQPRPLDDRTPLILRVESVSPGAGGQFYYALHYIGLEPGTYQLADYLVHPDGSLASEIDGQVVQVRAVLPPDHDGVLNAYLPEPFPWFGGYRMALGLLAVLWLAGIAMFIYFGRKRRPAAPPPPAPPPPTYAQRLQPFVEAAAAGTLTPTGQAELERLLTGFWRDKLALTEPRMADALARLKRHSEAGALLRALERWLHRPGGATREEVAGLLNPYRQPQPAATTGEEGA